MEQLAIHGGKPAKTTPFGTGKRFAGNELKYLQEALEQNTLFYWFGEKVKALTKNFAALYGTKYCMATSSGTAAIHTALGAIGLTAGDEVITSPVTDMGSIIGILFQNAIPVFADLDPDSYNLDPKSIAEKITPRTKAIVVVHLAGNAADMDPIMELARRHHLYVIEDCAQSYMCYYKGRLTGTIGDIGCFSLNDFKQISAGDGGLVITNNQDLYTNCFKFADKNYNRLANDMASMRKVEYLAPNYRMTELQGAVGLAQIEKLADVCNRRSQFGTRLSEALAKLKGIYPQKVYEGGKSSYWFYLFRIEKSETGFSATELVEMLKAEGIPCQQGYIPTCVYEYDMFLQQTAYQNTHCPFTCPHHPEPVDYHHGLCPNAEAILENTVRINFDEFAIDEDLHDIIHAMQKISAYYTK